MNLSQIIGLLVALTLFPSASTACIILNDERSASEVRQKSKKVQTDSQCRTVNIGVFDVTALGPAQSFGNGRIVQKVDEDDSKFLIADCRTRELTVLQGRTTETHETSCGPQFEFGSLLDKSSGFDLRDGENLSQLVAFAKENGARELNPHKLFYEFNLVGHSKRYAVGRKDRFDLLCGCKIYYPDSKGAKS